MNIPKNARLTPTGLVFVMNWLEWAADRRRSKDAIIDGNLELQRLGLNRLSKLGRIARIGHLIHGEQSKKVQGVSWEFYHAAIDDASRIAYGEVLPNERMEDVTVFLQRVVSAKA